MKRHDVGIVAACLVIMACVLGAAMGSCIDMRDPAGPQDIPETTTTTLLPVAPQPAFNLPVPLTPATVSVSAMAERAPAIQVTEPVAPPPNVPPSAIPGDCGSWQAIFRWYGATDEEIYFFFAQTPWGRRNVIMGESGCGLRFRNPDTTDTGICQLNGIHRGWVGELFGLRLGYGVSESEASNPDYVRPCLYLLRGGYEPGSMKGACNWRPGRWCT